MSLECGECERDLRGGHDPGCSRHPVNKNKKHPLYKTIKVLRKFLGDRDDHHAVCNTRKGGICDCYAKGREQAHEALDALIDYSLDEPESF